LVFRVISAHLEWNFKVILSFAVAAVVRSLRVLRRISPTMSHISSKTAIRRQGIAVMMMMMTMMLDY